MPDLEPDDWDRILLNQECGAVVDLLRAGVSTQQDQQVDGQKQPETALCAPPAEPMPQGAPMLRASLIALIFLAGHAHGQGFGGGFPPPLPPPPFAPENPFIPAPGFQPPAPPPNSAEARREARDQVLRSVGPEALAFTKKFGDLGIAALQQCSPETGKRLIALFNNGQYARLTNQQGALETIRQNGEPAAAWLCNNIGKLSDPEALQCFNKSALDYAFDLKDIERDAEELRASRKLMPSWLKTETGEWNMTAIGMGGAALVLLAAVLWKRRQIVAPVDR
jgi:hypothetical protein